MLSVFKMKYTFQKILPLCFVNINRNDYILLIIHFFYFVTNALDCIINGFACLS